MFKKPFSTSQAHKVSGADRKKLRRALEKVFVNPNEADFEAFLPAKAGELELAKLAPPFRGHIYILDGCPIIVDISGKSDFVPTVLGLWRSPQALKQIYLKHPAVSQYVVNGADVMLPGVAVTATSFPSFVKGDLLAVFVPGNPAPIAVGTATLSSEDAQSRAASGGKGKLLELISYYGDCLWSTVGNKAIPNPGFWSNAVVPLGFDPSGDIMEAEYYSERQSPQTMDDSTASADAAPGTVEAESQLTEDIKSLELVDGSTISNSNGNAADLEDNSPSTSGTAGATPEAARIRTEDMDQLLETALLQAIFTSVKEADLPMSSGAFYTHHMLPARPAGSTLDIKHSSYRKMSKFFAAYGGKHGLLHLKEDKHSGDTIITGVNQKHAKYESYRPYKKSNTASAVEGINESTSQAPTVSGNHTTADLIVEEVYKLGKEARPVMEALKRPLDGLYTAAELTDIAFTYVRTNGLDTSEKGSPDNATVVLDAYLCDALYKGVINTKKGEMFPTHIAKADLGATLVARASCVTRLTRGTEQVIKKGTPPVLSVTADKRSGNKKVTRISGLEDFLIDPAAFAIECQHRFAASSSVSALPGKHAGQEVVVQGGVADPVADHLRSAYGVPGKYISVHKKA